MKIEPTKPVRMEDLCNIFSVIDLMLSGQCASLGRQLVRVDHFRKALHISLFRACFEYISCSIHGSIACILTSSHAHKRTKCRQFSFGRGESTPRAHSAACAPALAITTVPIAEHVISQSSKPQNKSHAFREYAQNDLQMYFESLRPYCRYYRQIDECA